MPKRSFLAAVIALFLALVETTLVEAETRDHSRRLNFVIMIADDISDEDLACYGHPTIKTPNIDRLAAQGLRFTNAFLTTSSCSPSRCSLITGRYPHNTGAPELHTLLPDSQIRFPELLRQAGYYTALSGKNHMFDGEDRAFETVSSGGGPGKSDDWVEQIRNRPRDRPFLFWFGSGDAHRIWQMDDANPRYQPEDAVVPEYLVDTERTRADFAQYYHEISRFDRAVGTVCAELERQRVIDSTVVLVMADNGRPFPRCKTRLYADGIRTPLIVSCPNLVNAAVSDSLLSSIDIAPTILQLADVPVPETVQGVSFRSLLSNPQARIRDVVFAEHNWHVFRNHERMVLAGDFLYIKNNYVEQPNLCTEAFMNASGEELWRRHSTSETTDLQDLLFEDPPPAEELYRISTDPDQLQNLIGESQYSQELTTLRELLARWTDQTGDSIPAHPTPNRMALPCFVDGSLEYDKSRLPGWSHREMPGSSRSAEVVHKPGPVRLPAEQRLFLLSGSSERVD